MYKLSCVKQTANGKLLHSTRKLSRVLSNDLQGRDGVFGREAQEGRGYMHA